MGMTIDECIEYMEAEYRYTINEDDMADEEDIEALRTVLETMKKYQKIEHLVKFYKNAGEIPVFVLEGVLEGGNDEQRGNT